MTSNPAPPTMKSEEEWKKLLTPEQFHVARQHGTERPFSSPLNNEKRTGLFKCVCCGAPLFSSSTKFDSARGSCAGPRSVAHHAMHISAMSFPMAPSQQERAIA